MLRKGILYALSICAFGFIEFVQAEVPVPAFAGTNIFKADGVGATQRSVEDKLKDIKNLKDFGCDATGTKDATSCVQNALNSLAATGGRIKVNGKFQINNNLNVPPAVTLEGDCVLPGFWGGAQYGTMTCGVLAVNPAATIKVATGSGLKDLMIYRAGMHFPAPNSASFAGTAITVAGNDVGLDHLLVMGFNKAVYGSGVVRTRIDYLYGDNNNGIELTHSGDIIYISHCHMWPFASIGSNGGLSTQERKGYGYYFHDQTDWAKISDSFAYGYLQGFRLENVNAVSLLNVGADNTFAGTPQHAGTIGIAVLGSSSETRIINPQTAAQAVAGIYINTTAKTGNVTQIYGGDVWGGGKHGILIDSGDAIITGENIRGGVYGITVNHPTSMVTQYANRFESLTGSNFNMVKGASFNNVAPAGTGGEYQANAATKTVLKSGTPANAASLKLSAGDWDVSGVVCFVPAAATTVSGIQAGINTQPLVMGGLGTFTQLQSNFTAGAQQCIEIPLQRINAIAPTMVYAVVGANFAVSSMTANGFIRARRIH